MFNGRIALQNDFLRTRVAFLEEDRGFASTLGDRLKSTVESIWFLSCERELLEIPEPRVDVLLIGVASHPRNVEALVRRVRSFDPYVWIVVRSSSPRGVESVVVLEAGADDYICAFDDVTLVEARIRVALRRRIACATCGDSRPVTHCEEQNLVTSLPDRVGMTRIEERLWNALVRARGGVVPTTALMKSGWGHSKIEHKLLYEHISKLRSRVHNSGWTIQNLRGTGYQLLSFEKTSPQF